MKQLSVQRLLKARLWLASLFRPREQQITLFWAGIVGFMGGLSSSAFRELISLLQFLFTHETGGLVVMAEALSWWQRLLLPCAGGLLAGMILHLGGRWLRAGGSTDYMEAIVLSDGVIPVRPVLMRSSSSLVTIATGGSIGREGAMVQLSAMLASALGQVLGVPTPRMRLLVACGVAAGIASAYKVPIAGSLFVAEIVLGSISMESFGPLVFSAVIATLTVRQFVDPAPLYSTAGVPLSSSWEILPYLVLGVLAGVGGPLFLRMLRASERQFARIPGPVYVRLAVGGLIVGGLSIFRPEVWGNGYSVVTTLLKESWGWQALCVVFVCKMLATAATVGSGAVGGVFTPTLFVGAVLGFLFEQAYHAIWPNLASDPRAYALVGMGCFLAATTHAPLMAMILLFEMTLDYDIILPLMLACVTAYYTAYGIQPDSIYTETLRRKQRGAIVPARRGCVGDLLKPDPVSITQSASLVEIALAFARSQVNHLYVVDNKKCLCGVISLQDIKEYLDEEALSQLVAAFDLMNNTIPALTPEMGVSEAVGYFARHKGERLPVISDREGRRLMGSVSKTDLLLSLAHGGVY